jgi:hypothetical protein
MKFLLTWAFALFVTLAVSAQSSFADISLPATLKSTMKAMGDDLKKISAQVQNSQLNSDSTSLAEQFVQLAQHSKTFVPEIISQMPASQQPEAKAHFDELLTEVIDLGEKLVTAFRDNDNPTCVQILKQLANAKKNGHNIFNP